MISPKFLGVEILYKCTVFCRVLGELSKTQRKLSVQNFAFPQNLRARQLGEISVLYTMGSKTKGNTTVMTL